MRASETKAMLTGTAQIARQDSRSNEWRLHQSLLCQINDGGNGAACDHANHGIDLVVLADAHTKTDE